MVLFRRIENVEEKDERLVQKVKPTKILKYYSQKKNYQNGTYVVEIKLEKFVCVYGLLIFV